MISLPTFGFILGAVDGIVVWWSQGKFAELQFNIIKVFATDMTSTQALIGFMLLNGLIGLVIVNMLLKSRRK